MTGKELLEWCSNYLDNNDILEFPEEIFKEIDDSNSKFIVEKLGNTTLMKLPSKEIIFFEWLKKNDEKIWNDLWQSDEMPYIVALNFLPHILENSRGFPICDLLNNDNYYFSSDHIIEKEAKLFIESVQQMYRDRKKMTVEQSLALEISLEPIDIWRFAYRYNLKIDRVKTAVENLKEDGIMVHLKKAEHLAGYIEW